MRAIAVDQVTYRTNHKKSLERSCLQCQKRSGKGNGGSCLDPLRKEYLKKGELLPTGKAVECLELALNQLIDYFKNPFDNGLCSLLTHGKVGVNGFIAYPNPFRDTGRVYFVVQVREVRRIY